jgi:hypothetical protein
MVTSKKRADFAICVADQGYEDLNAWKVYRVLPDRKATELGCMRVIDESGEDYLYPADRFVTVNFPKPVLAKLPGFQPRNGSQQQSTGGRRRAVSQHR